jgi:hypothetical protein
MRSIIVNNNNYLITTGHDGLIRKAKVEFDGNAIK